MTKSNEIKDSGSKLRLLWFQTAKISMTKSNEVKDSGSKLSLLLISCFTSELYLILCKYMYAHFSLYSSPDIIRQVKSRRMRWVGHVACMGEERKVYKVLVGKPKGKRPLGRPRRRWEDGIRMDLREIGLGSVDWIQLAQDRDRWRAIVNAVMNLRVLAPRS
jgi:hypothetical protein